MVLAYCVSFGLINEATTLPHVGQWMCMPWWLIGVPERFGSFLGIVVPHRQIQAVEAGLWENGVFILVPSWVLFTQPI